jgi:hypothetical protein
MAALVRRLEHPGARIERARGSGQKTTFLLARIAYGKSVREALGALLPGAGHVPSGVLGYARFVLNLAPGPSFVSQPSHEVARAGVVPRVPSWLWCEAQLQLAPNVSGASVDHLGQRCESGTRSPAMEAPASTTAEPLSTDVVGRLHDVLAAAVRAGDRDASSTEAPAVRVPTRPRAVAAAAVRSFVRVGDESVAATGSRALALLGEGMEALRTRLRAVVPHPATELSGRRREHCLASLPRARPLTGGSIGCRRSPPRFDRLGELMPMDVSLRLVLHIIQPAIGLTCQVRCLATAAVTEAVGSRAVRVEATGNAATAARHVSDRRGCYRGPRGPLCTSGLHFVPDSKA